MRRTRIFHLALGLWLSAGCSDPAGPGAPADGALAIDVQQRGLLLDDGFVVVINGGQGIAIGTGKVNVSLPAGTHTVVLQDVAPNCGVTGPASATAVVQAATQGVLTFSVKCWLTAEFRNGSLAWVRVRGGTESLELTRGTELNAGEDVRVLAMPPGHVLHGPPSWSPDGEEIAVVTYVEDPKDPVGHRLTVLREDGTGSTVIAEGPYDLDWSPVGGAIAYTTVETGATGAVWVADRGAGWALRRLWDGGGGSVWNPAWSPDGQVLAVASVVSGQWDLVLLSTDGRLLRKLPREGNHEPDNPAWSPDGRKIAYIRWIPVVDDFGDGYYSTQLYILDLETGADVDVPLNERGGFPTDVAWLPDGSGLVVQATTDRVRHLCLYVVPLDGRPPRQLVSCETAVYGFAVTPH